MSISIIFACCPVIRRSKVHAPAGHTVSNATMLDHDPESTYYGTPDTVASDEAEAVACSNANKVRREEIDYDVASLDQYQVDRVPSGQYSKLKDETCHSQFTTHL